MLITTATFVVTVMYGALASKIKNTLQPYGVEVILGATMFAATWLAVFFLSAVQLYGWSIFSAVASNC
jgi:hypothetical protein